MHPTARQKSIVVALFQPSPKCNCIVLLPDNPILEYGALNLTDRQVFCIKGPDCMVYRSLE